MDLVGGFFSWRKIVHNFLDIYPPLHDTLFKPLNILELHVANGSLAQ